MPQKKQNSEGKLKFAGQINLSIHNLLEKDIREETNYIYFQRISYKPKIQQYEL